MADNTRKYLDYQGLRDFWTLVKEYYTTNGAGTVNLADNATKFANPLTVNFGGDATGVLTFDGSEGSVNVDLSVASASTALTGVKVDGVDQTVEDHVAILDLATYAKKSDITAIFRFKGVVSTVEDLPDATAAEVGDVYIVEAGNSEYVCVEKGDPKAKAWEKLGPVIDLSNYYTKSEVDAKCDELAEGIDEEFERAQTQEGLLSEAITAVKNDLATEVSAREAADVALQTAIDAKQGKLTAGAGIVIENNTITYDPDELATVLYVDDSISATMLYIDQQDASEHAGRVAGDNLLNKRVDVEISDRKAEDTSIIDRLMSIEDYQIRALFNLAHVETVSELATKIQSGDFTEGDVLALDASGTLADTLFTPNGGSLVTLDLNGKTLTGATNKRVINVSPSSTIEIVGGTVQGASSNGVLYASTRSNVFIDGAEIKSTNIKQYAIVTNGQESGMNVTIRDAKITGRCYIPAMGKLVIENSVFDATSADGKGLCALNIRGGEVIIKNTKFMCNGQEGDWFHYTNGMVALGCPVLIEASNYGGHANPVVSIDEACTFEFTEGEYEVSTPDRDGNKKCKNYGILCIDYKEDFGDYSGIKVPYQYVHVTDTYESAAGPYKHFYDGNTEARNV